MASSITQTTGSLWSGMIAGFTSFMDFIPSLIGAVLLLAIGWYASSLVGRLVEKGLHALKFEKAVAHSGLGQYFPSQTPPLTGSHIVGVLSKWFIFLIFIQAAANALRVPQVTAVINSILLFLPQILVALVILVAGSALSRFFGNVVEAALGRMGMSNAKALSMITRYAVFGFAVVAAVNQLGIATNLINILFTGLVGSLTLAFGLAFGLGGQTVAGEITKHWYDQGRESSSRLRPISGGGGASGSGTPLSGSASPKEKPFQSQSR